MLCLPLPSREPRSTRRADRRSVLTRLCEATLVASEIVVELVAWNEAGTEPARPLFCSSPLADQGANVVHRAAELGGDVVDGERLGPVHGAKYCAAG